MFLCCTHNTEANHQRKPQTPSWLMNYYNADGSRKVHHMPKIIQHFSDADTSYQLQNIKVV